MRLLYRQSFPAVFASLLTGALVCIALLPAQQLPTLLTWYALLGFSAVARVVLFLQYRRLLPQGEELLKWKRPYEVTLLASTLIWGIGAVFIMPRDSFLHQVLLFFFLVGMSGGALGVYSPHRKLMLATITILLLPATLWLAFQATPLSSVMVIGIIALLITAVQASEILSSHMHQSFLLSLVLDEARHKAERMAREDELTGVSNRRAFYEEGEALRDRREAKESLLAMILVDVDHFKQINDCYGHANGDLVLRKVADVLRETVRRGDVCARIGGEEFGILFRVADAEDALKLAQKLCRRIASTAIPLHAESASNDVSVTASFGVTTGNFNLDALFRAADAALYRAKDQGRNRVEYAVCTG